MKTNSIIRTIIRYCLEPFVFFLIQVLAFGIAILFCGYYLDDWIILSAYVFKGVDGLVEYTYLDNRPLVFWIWWIGFKLLGTSPVGWQIWSLAWRSMTSWVAYLFLKKIFPRYEFTIFLVVSLFGVYPIFKQQAAALTFSFHWICNFFLFFSFYLMIIAIQNSKKRVIYTGLSLFFSAAQLFSQEFFVGLELLRPIIIWYLIAPEFNLTQRLRRTLLFWSPYFVLFCLYLLWRFKFMPTPGFDRNIPALLLNLMTFSIKNWLDFVSMILQSYTAGLIDVWSVALSPQNVKLTNSSSFIYLGLVIMVFIILRVVVNTRNVDLEKDIDQVFGKRIILFGLVIMGLGFAPGWMIYRHIYTLTGLYNDRFGLAAMLGASFVVAGFLHLILRNKSIFTYLMIFLISIAVSQGARFTNAYRLSWEKQNRLYWQMKWRMPDLKENTIIYGDGALVAFMGSWANASAINLLYSDRQVVDFASYWYTEMSDVDISSRIEQAQIVTHQKNQLRYKGKATESIAISFNPEVGRCLWILDDEDQYNVYLTKNEKESIKITDKTRILNLPERYPNKEIFAPEPSHEWCYFYLKADLARDHQDWDTIVNLWKDAQGKNFRPLSRIEYSPFIEAKAHLGDWDAAVDLSRKAAMPKYEMREFICETWLRIDQSTIFSNEKMRVMPQIIEEFECQDTFRPIN